MKIRIGNENLCINANTLMMESVKRERIVLPYIGKMNDGITHEAYNAFTAALGNAEHCNELFAQSDINVCVQLHPSRTTPLASLIIEITTPDRQTIMKRIEIKAPVWEITDLLTDYFTNGALGLDREYARCFMNQYRQYCRKCVMRGGIGMNPAYREVMREMSELMKSGYTAEQIMQAMA